MTKSKNVTKDEEDEEEEEEEEEKKDGKAEIATTTKAPHVEKGKDSNDNEETKANSTKSDNETLNEYEDMKEEGEGEGEGEGEEEEVNKNTTLHGKARKHGTSETANASDASENDDNGDASSTSTSENTTTDSAGEDKEISKHSTSVNTTTHSAVEDKKESEQRVCAGWKCYIPSSGKACPEADLISNAKQCEAALQLLKYDFQFRGSTSNPERPTGCFYSDSEEAGQFNKKEVLFEPNVEGIHSVCARCLTDESDNGETASSGEETSGYLVRKIAA